MMFDKAHILSVLDLTSLSGSETDADIAALCAKAIQPFGHAAAVCIFDKFLTAAKLELPRNSGVRLATVVNFPKGEGHTAVADTATALAFGAKEIDFVFPYASFQAGKTAEAEHLTATLATLCHAGEAHLKVILETGEMNDDSIRATAQAAIRAGADFLKTSTGKTQTGATPEAAAILLEEIKASGKTVGLKVSGGIKTITDAQNYMRQAAEIMGEDWVTPQHFRIGSSTLLDALLADDGGSIEADTAAAA